jgi:signal transduction histidine kinase
MIKLRYKLGLFNVISKLIFGLLFLIFMPIILERVNTLQTDNELIEKREQVIDIISEWGVDFLVDDLDNAFGSYNILKEEYISLERIDLDEPWNFIEVTQRQVEDEVIDYRVLNYSFLVDGETYLLEIGKSLSSIRQTEKNIRRFTLFLLILFIMATVISDISFGARLIKPLEAIANKLKQTISPADFDPTPISSSTAEFNYLDRNIRELMTKINELFQKEKETTANISHELLTPVSILRSKLENLLIKPDLDDDVVEKIEESLKTLYRLKSMVNSLLLIARVESHQFLKEDDFLVNDLLNEMVEELEPMTEDKDIMLKCNFPANIRMKSANRHLIFTMFYNVLNNAVKFTPDGGRIIIEAKKESDKFHSVMISDTGRGMNEEQIAKLFSRFKKDFDSNEEGSGIGLAIAKTIADFHKIKIVVKSKPGEGSAFFFRFMV